MSETIELTPFWSGVLAGAVAIFVVSAVIIWLLAARHRRTVTAINRQAEQWLADRHQLATGFAVAEQKIADLQRLELKIADEEVIIAALRDENVRLKSSLAEVTARIEEERIKATEKLEVIKSTEQQMIHQFESLSSKILEEKSKTFTEQNQLNLDRLLSPLRDQLGEFRRKVDDVYVADSNDRASLREAIRILNLENQRISLEANNGPRLEGR